MDSEKSIDLFERKNSGLPDYLLDNFFYQVVIIFRNYYDEQ